MTKLFFIKKVYHRLWKIESNYRLDQNVSDSYNLDRLNIFAISWNQHIDIVRSSIKPFLEKS